MIQVQDNLGNVYNLQEPKIINLKIDGEELNIIEPVFEEILNQLKFNKYVDITGKDPFFIAYIQEFVKFGLLMNPTSQIYPLSNQFKLIDEEFLEMLIRMFNSKKAENNHVGLIL